MAGRDREPRRPGLSSVNKLQYCVMKFAQQQGCAPFPKMNEFWTARYLLLFLHIYLYAVKEAFFTTRA